MLLSGYPRNHNYQIFTCCLMPGFRLYERMRLVSRAYSESLRSFLDIGCCRGFYVLDAATRLKCPLAVGIDIHEPFVSTAQKVVAHAGTANSHFHLTSLEDISRNPQQYGGPFQTVMLIGTYHYLFWGSSLCPTAYHSHDDILSRLASICTDRLIFSARVTMDQLPVNMQGKLNFSRNNVPYTPEAFLKSADKFFSVRHAGYLGVYPLLIMTKKHP
jgi:hypothetical protein